MSAPPLRVAPSELGDMPHFTTAEAEGRGISRRDLAVFVRRGLFWQPARGWYSSRTDAQIGERHLIRAAAVLRSQAEGAVAIRHTAAVVLGLPLVRTDLGRVEIGTAGGAHGRTTKGARVTGVDLDQLACVEVQVPGLGTLRHGLCTPGEIAAALDVARGATGVGQAREALVHLEPKHESPGETLTAAVLRGSRWDFEPQVWQTVAGRSYRMDFANEELMLAVEFDGQVKYVSPEVKEDELAREEDLRSIGWDFVRVVWDDFEDERQIQREVDDKATARARGLT
ncbi:hypothetical protein ON003_07365 [Janibacter hoylei]|uniref:hypothetical protein n=1 Tax=Janibacter hoylei TaxID=364298 RepID=UPI0022385005|nr:hypothetical protein [Janibacter hoylei]MCW4601427.1 hypothetical protein [Janibacter hoylei]